MSYDLTDLEKWVRVPGEGGLKFPTVDPRQIRLECLSEEPTRLYVHHEKHKHFVGLVDGYEVIKFQINGPFRLVADGPGCKVWTPEIESAGAVEIPEAVSFTTMMTRRERNPIMEQMMHKMQQNMERRLRRTERDMELRLNPERRIADIEKSIEEFRAATAAQSAQIIEPSDDEDLDAGASSTGDGDGLPKRGSKPGRQAVAAKPAT